MKRMIIPQVIKKGSTIGLVAPSFAITEEQLKISIQHLEDIGFKVNYSEHILSNYGYFANTDQQRADDLMEKFADKQINAIMCVRGGYGCSRISQIIDYKIIKENPKPFIGYSDITFLQNAILKKTGLVTFHGLTGVCDYNSFSIKSLMNVLTQPLSNYIFPYKREKDTESLPEFDKYTINKGKASGILIGGNLSVLVSMIGTDFEPDFKNKLVFIEDIDERTYRIDRMLTHLIQATNLKKSAGIIFGVFKNCSEKKTPRFSLKESIEGLIKPLEIPSSYGLSFGHIKNKITIPIGLKANFDADRKELQLDSNIHL